MEKDNKELIKLIKESIKEVFNESGYSRVANIMRGLVPSVKTFSILTAENPNGIEQDKDNNRIKNQELEKNRRHRVQRDVKYPETVYESHSP